MLRSTFRLAFLAVCLLALLPACPAAIGAGVVLVAGGSAVVAYTCEDPVRVIVTDPATGNRVCNATVTATIGDSTATAVPCFSLALSEGTWTIRAEKPGYQPVGSVVTVDHDAGCKPVIHRVELTLVPVGGVSTPLPVGLPTGAPAPIPPAAVPPAPTPIPPAAAPPAPAPPLPPAPVPSAQGGSTLPAAPPSATPPVAPSKTTPPSASFPEAPTE